jgi:hypothetical protein
MDRNRLAGTAGDKVNAILSAAGMNFSKLLNYAAAFLRLYLRWLFAASEQRIFVSEQRTIALTRKKTGFQDRLCCSKRANFSQGRFSKKGLDFCPIAGYIEIKGTI